MSKKLVVIAGIVGLAAIAAAAVAFFLTRNKAICEVLEEDDDEIRSGWNLKKYRFWRRENSLRYFRGLPI